MVSPLNIFCWFGYTIWTGLSAYYLATLDLKEGLLTDIFVAVVILLGCLGVFLILNYFFPDEPEEIDPESDATEL